MPLCIMKLSVTTLSIQCHYVGYHVFYYCAECCYAGCIVVSIVAVIVIMMSFVYASAINAECPPA
jgi:hypothetical protein